MPSTQRGGRASQLISLSRRGVDGRISCCSNVQVVGTSADRHAPRWPDKASLMTTVPAISPDRDSARRQFSLRTLLVAVSLTAVVLGGLRSGSVFAFVAILSLTVLTIVRSLRTGFLTSRRTRPFHWSFALTALVGVFLSLTARTPVTGTWALTFMWWQVTEEPGGWFSFNGASYLGVLGLVVTLLAAILIAGLAQVLFSNVNWSKPRFGMKSIMGLIAAFAVLFWLLWVQWPKYKALQTLALGIEQKKYMWRGPNSRGLYFNIMQTDLDTAERLNATSWVVMFLARSLKHQDDEVRLLAVGALQGLGKKAHLAVPMLAQALQDDNDTVRGSAASALGIIGEPAEVAIPDLVRSLNDQDHRARDQAAWAITKISPGQAARLNLRWSETRREYVWDSQRPEASSAIPSLIQALDDIDRAVRVAAADTLGQFGSESESAVAALIKSLEDVDWSVRSAAARALGQIGSAASPAVPRLVELLNDSVENVCNSAAEALGRIDPKATIKNK